MVHVFMYHSGLNGEVGDLLVLPGSHKKIMNGDAFRQFGCADLPESRTINDLAPASVVIVHSALQHARRAKPANPDPNAISLTHPIANMESFGPQSVGSSSTTKWR